MRLHILNKTQGGIIRSMYEPYLCPICHENRTRFTLIYKLAQEVQLDARTGEPLYEAQELEAVLRPDGRPDLEVQCNSCQYVAPVTAFTPQRERKRNSGKAHSHRKARR